ncbi:hypothetical protein Pla110_33220 [Polystyrenella longa]|uniref:Uncharacterized protein n=1 Tax=Polystyrenella longa TaxID=2528007 RepID=A0A518CQU4_9PLAN|nr:hypothetical protein Pla110_33220 [Polystyrenella longa]
MVDRDTFNYMTQAVFRPVIKPNRIPDYVSESGSQYWYENDGVIRHSDHWGTVASCLWSCTSTTGFCKFNKFIDLNSGIYRHLTYHDTIDLRKPLPRGWCHVSKYSTERKLGHWLSKLNIRHYPALKGFDKRSPEFDGYVIPSRSKKRLIKEMV